MSIDAKWYLIEFTVPDSVVYHTQEVMAEDPYEAIDELKKEIVGLVVENVYLLLNGSWNKDE
jgi:hypothetical protein